MSTDFSPRDGEAGLGQHKPHGSHPVGEVAMGEFRKTSQEEKEI